MRNFLVDWVRKVSAADLATTANAVLGFVAITYVIDRRFYEAAALVVASVVVDGLDGLLARRWGSKHGGGHVLDSFADVICFCIVPALMVYTAFYDPAKGSAWSDLDNALAVAASTLVAAFGILRLVRFVQLDYTHEAFLGFPTPANALFLVPLVLLFGDAPFKPAMLVPANPVVLGLAILSSFLMVSNVPYPKVSDALRLPTTAGLAVVAALVLAFAVLVRDVGSFVRLFLILLLLAMVAYTLGGPIYVRKTRPDGEVLQVQ